MDQLIPGSIRVKRNGRWVLTSEIEPGDILQPESSEYVDPDPGPTGSGGYVPQGGTTGQVLTKLSNADYDVGWR